MVGDAGLARMFVPKASALEGLRDGTLHRIGSVIYHVGGGIHSHMQETAAFDPEAIASRLAGMTGTLNGVSSGVQMIKVLQLANVALTAIDIGVSVVGFAVMNAKLNALRDEIQAMSESFDTLRAERIEEDFVLLTTYVERFEEAWFMRAEARAG